MKWWTTAAIVIAAGGILWYVLSTPTDETDLPGKLSGHEVDQAFNPYLNDDSDGTQEEELSPVPDDAEREDVDDPSNDGALDANTMTSDDAETVEEGSPPGEDPVLEEDDDVADDRPPRDRTDSNLTEGSPITTEEARTLADSYLAGAASDPERILGLYAEHVNYYDEGRVDRAAVMRDKRNYLSRWPERRYERVSDVEVSDAGNATLIRFQYEFEVGGGARRADGIGWAELGVQPGADGFQIVSERGAVTDRR